MRLAAVLAACLAIAGASHALAQEPETDPLTGLKVTGDWQLVRNNCVGCHSAKLITQQSGTESRWLALIRWMQATQNLWQFEPEVE